jgi:hypothetical protein
MPSSAAPLAQTQERARGCVTLPFRSRSRGTFTFTRGATPSSHRSGLHALRPRAAAGSAARGHGACSAGGRLAPVGAVSPGPIRGEGPGKPAPGQEVPDA